MADPTTPLGRIPLTTLNIPMPKEYRRAQWFNRLA